ncbi:hypothetical protein [Pantoea sp.]|uniref:hypothetical protein n=1 Tax=Pantoea sp. TaxID=69393 RepID=UPI0029035823|nr:hypothetical protein [Pantoea sp.]MDU2730681.1 hypothetical protein [Pantoea sp.]
MSTLLQDYQVELSPEIISGFRNAVNDNNSFLFNYFKNRSGKNHWNAICSCMDWISVAVRYINNYPELSRDMDVKAMQIYSLISSIDIIHESLVQLHRIIINGSTKNWPFKGQAHLFKNKVQHLSHCDDDDYFREIRAIFGAHPTALRSGEGERMFASWPHDHSFKGEDFTVNLYSNIPDKKDINFGLYINELLTYAKDRYEYLFQLKKSLNSLFHNHCIALADEDIPKSDNIINEINILSTENAARLGSDYYHGILWDLDLLFRTHLTEPHLQEEERKYKDELLKLVNEVRGKLQSMIEIDLEHDYLLPNSLPKHHLQYDISKVLSSISNDRHDPLLPMFIRNFNEYSDNHYEFKLSDSINVIYLKLKLMMYAKIESNI